MVVFENRFPSLRGLPPSPAHRSEPADGPPDGTPLQPDGAPLHLSRVLAAIERAGFVSDHVETLYEVDQLFAETARRAGIAHFRRTTGLNDRPTFLRALADLAISIRPFWG